MIKKIINKASEIILNILSFNTFKYVNKSYSQEGEDLFLSRYFKNKKEGYFIDVGAHHPQKFSNTYMLYKKGWNGVNIDAMPNSMKPFNKTRNRDQNIEIGVSKKAGMLKYFSFNAPAVNTFSEIEAKEKIEKKGYILKKTYEINTLPLADILNKHVPHNQVIDFMTIDVEGLDMEVIETNDWNKFRPKLVLIEDLASKSIQELLDSDLNIKMISLGYRPVSKLFYSVIFEDTRHATV